MVFKAENARTFTEILGIDVADRDFNDAPGGIPYEVTGAGGALLAAGSSIWRQLFIPGARCQLVVITSGNNPPSGLLSTVYSPSGCSPSSSTLDLLDLATIGGRSCIPGTATSTPNTLFS